MKVKKQVLLDSIINSLLAGQYPSQIARNLKISKQKVAYYIRKLKDEGLIKNIGYGVWETSKNLPKVGRTIRGHAFMWKVRLPKTINWSRVTKLKKLNPKPIGLRDTPRIIFRDRKVWLGQKNIIIYEPRSFLANNSLKAKEMAIYQLLRILRGLESKLGVSLQGEEGYLFKVARHHYSLIKNILAIQCNADGKKVKVSNQNGMWFLIDNSYNLDEAETVHPDSAMMDSLGMQKYFNSHKETGFEVTPQFILKAFAAQAQTQTMNAQNIIKHQKVLDEMLITMKAIRDGLSQLGSSDKR